ncbi:keratin, type II cytoskeletal 1-like [Cynara cardunculus var. scolymus]|uniref:keratin, type II cytoskeletal 1-like n=1 Tax=Cynara cardunculus var. scolymus TaxID=59895 RepID=UPI000D6308EB|nr:keratin, type II cytoskeletal 1-like [Cynara cardunculus var. scolymus]
MAHYSVKAWVRRRISPYGFTLGLGLHYNTSNSGGGDDDGDGGGGEDYDSSGGGSDDDHGGGGGSGNKGGASDDDDVDSGGRRGNSGDGMGCLVRWNSPESGGIGMVNSVDQIPFQRMELVMGQAKDCRKDHFLAPCDIYACNFVCVKEHGHDIFGEAPLAECRAMWCRCYFPCPKPPVHVRPPMKVRKLDVASPPSQFQP